MSSEEGTGRARRVGLIASLLKGRVYRYLGAR